MMTDSSISNTAVDVSVSDPQHHGEGRGKYTSYLVEVQSPTRSACRRRYSDFKWLYERLSEERPGAIVPIIPHKQALTSKKRFSDELVTDRLDCLQTWLERVMKHPELGDTPSLTTFLTADYAHWEMAKKQYGNVTAGEGSEEAPLDLGNQIAAVEPKSNQAGSRITNWMGKVRTKIALAAHAGLESTPDDDIFNDIESYATNLDNNIKILSKDATAFVQATKTQSEKMEQMGAAFAELGEYKLANDTIVRSSSSTFYSKLGQNWNNLSKLCNFQQMSAQTKLDEPLQDMARDVSSLRIAISKRKEILYQYTVKSKQSKTKMGQLDKMRENGTSLDKIGALEIEVRTIKEETAKIWKDVETVSKRLSRDVERFKVIFHEKMRSTMEAFHMIQVEYSEKYVQGWKDALPILAPLSSGTGTVASTTSVPSRTNGPVTAML